MRFFGALAMIIVSELLIAGSAIWVHEAAGGIAALMFTVGGIAVWLNLLPDIVSASQEIDLTPANKFRGE